MWTQRVEFHIIFTYHKILLLFWFFSSYLKNYSFGAIEEQVVWTRGHQLNLCLTNVDKVRRDQRKSSEPQSKAMAFNFLFLKKIIYLVSYLFLAVLGLHWCTRAFSSCGEWGLLSDGTARASHFGGFSCCGARALGVGNFSSCGAHAQLLRGTWNPPGAGIEPKSPALAGGFSTTGPSGESCSLSLDSVPEPLTREAFVDPPPLPLGGSVPVLSSHWNLGLSLS